MKIKIISWEKSSGIEDLMSLEEAMTHMREVMGLKWCHPHFDVIDEKKFFLGVINCGLTYEVIDME